MKEIFWIQLILLLMADLIFGLTAINLLTGELSDAITLLDALLGPLQILTALVMVFMKKYHNRYFWAYLVIAGSAITVLIISVACFHFGGYDDSFIITMMYISFLIAHYFVYMLFRSAQLNRIAS